MGIFSNVLKGNERNDSFSTEEAFLGSIVAVTAADGDISDEEIADLNSISNKSRTLHALDNNRFNKAVEKVFRVLRTEGVDKLLDLSANGLSEDLYEGVFSLACDLAYSDGYIEKGEELVLEKLQSRFNIPNDKALNIVNVLTIKNKV